MLKTGAAAMLPIVFHREYMEPASRSRRLPGDKQRHLRANLVALNILASDHWFDFPPATDQLLNLAHDPAHVDRVSALQLDREQARALGVPITERMVFRSCLSVAGTLGAARLALTEGIGCHAAGGAHHAASSRVAGFCLFNDVAVAARALLAEAAVARVLIIDADVHQGDGTAEIFSRDPAVFTLSIHAGKNFPNEKFPSSMDISLDDQTGDLEYLEAFRAATDAAFERQRPDIVFYNAGVDPHYLDRLGRLGLTDGGLRARDTHVLGSAKDRGIPIVTVLGGGYANDASALGRRHSILFQEAARLFA